MAEYIEKQAAIEVARENGKKIPTLAIRTMEAIKSLPAADVAEVVRCKDCKQFRRWVNTDIEFCDLTESTVFGDDFCSRGERRELAQ